MGRDLFEKPQMVEEAAKAQKGMNWCLEMLVFVAVFFVSAIAMGILIAPLELVMLFSDAEYMQAAASGDLQAAMDATMRIASNEIYTVVSLVAQIVMILVVCLFCKLIQKRKMRTLGFVKKGFLKEYLLGLAAGFVFFSVTVLLGVVTGGLKVEGISAEFSIGMFALFALGFMFQGMAEEVMCRGYFMISYARRYPVYAAVLANALVFAALHIPNSGMTVLSFVNLALFGIFASVYMLHRGSIWGIGAFHSIWNLVQGNFYGIKVSGMEFGNSFLRMTPVEGKELLSGGDFGLEGSIWVTIVLIAGTVFMYYSMSKKQKGEANV